MNAVRPGSTLWTDGRVLPLDWHGPADRPFVPFAQTNKARPIAELLESVVTRHPARVALLDAKTTITYAELWREIAVWAEYITDVTAPGELVGILAPASIRFPVAMLACLAAGRAFVALDPHNPSEWLARTLKNSAPALLLVVDDTEITVRSSGNANRAGPLAGRRSASPSWRPARMTPDEPACILYTSGSTGDPKGIVNSQRNLLQRVSQSINAAHLNTDDRLLTLAPPCTIVGVRDALTALLAGASWFVLDAQKSGAAEILQVIHDYRITILFAFPALLRSVVQGSVSESARPQSASELRLVRIGGDTTLRSDIAALRVWLAPPAHIQLIYAATEAPMMQWFVTDAAASSAELGGVAGTEDRIPIGYPLPGNELMVIDADGLTVPQGAVGELVVRSPYVALGIWSEGRCKTEGVQVDPVDPGLRIWKSGDLVRQRADGFLERLGRKDRQVKIRGVRVELEGVEAAIRRHPRVRDVGVVAQTDADGTARLIAFVQWHADSERQSLSGLRETLSQSLPAHMLPWRFYAAPAIPRLPTSKLDVRALEKLAAAQLEQDASPSITTVSGPAAPIAKTWCEVLGIAGIGPEDDFFDLGGDSLRAIALMVALSKELGREVPLTLINRAPTFAAFCAALGADRSESYSPLVVIKPGREAPPLFLIHGASGCVMELFALGRNMMWPGAVIGIQAKGLDGRDTPHRTVEAMASEYLGAVKTQQPSGPYLLCGFSFGGSVALELARRLRDAGDEVAFVGLLDALPPGNQLLRVWTWAAYLWRDVAQRFARPTRRHRHGRAGHLAVARVRRMAINALRASVAYQPRPYAGDLTVFEASRRDLRVPSMTVHWSKYAKAVHYQSLPGRHMDFLTGAGAVTAAHLLTQCLRAAIK